MACHCLLYNLESLRLSLQAPPQHLHSKPWTISRRRFHRGYTNRVLNRVHERGQSTTPCWSSGNIGRSHGAGARALLYRRAARSLKSGVGHVRQCRSWEKLERWARSHNACYEYVNQTVEDLFTERRWRRYLGKCRPMRSCRRFDWAGGWKCRFYGLKHW